MPLYAYACPYGHGTIELIRRVDDRDLMPFCFEPGCDGQVPMEREMSAPVLTFKGPGWTPKFHRGEAKR